MQQILPGLLGGFNEINISKIHDKGLMNFTINIFKEHLYTNDEIEISACKKQMNRI